MTRTEELEDIIGKRPEVVKDGERIEDIMKWLTDRAVWEREAREHESARAEQFKKFILDHQDVLESAIEAHIDGIINKIDKGQS